VTRILFSAQRNEKPFLLEWVLYHRLIGFDRIIVFSNQCTDGSDELLDRMAALGLVEHHRHEPPESVPPQINAGRIAMEAGLFKNDDWVMWLDIDEFLNVKIGDGRLETFLDAVGDADAVAVAWRVFGDGGNLIWPGRQISNRFIGASKKSFVGNTNTKTIFRFSNDIERIDVHRPVFSDGLDPSSYRYLHGGNERLPDEFIHARFKGGIPKHRVNERNRYRLAQVNHYTVRTIDLYRLKRSRGNGYFTDKHSIVRHDDAFFTEYNRNEVEESSILRWEAPLTAEIAACADQMRDL